jgi:hypothetical protein
MTPTDDSPFAPAPPPPQRAFPSHPGTDPSGPGGGMTLRDYFAGQALAGILCDPDCHASIAKLVDSAYRYADAMLAARDKQP